MRPGGCPAGKKVSTPPGNFSGNGNGLLAASKTTGRNWPACRPRLKTRCSKASACSAFRPSRGRTISPPILRRCRAGPASSSGAPIRANMSGSRPIPSIWCSTSRCAYGTSANSCTRSAAKNWPSTAIWPRSTRRSKSAAIHRSKNPPPAKQTARSDRIAAWRLVLLARALELEPTLLTETRDETLRTPSGLDGRLSAVSTWPGMAQGLRSRLPGTIA